MSSEGLLVLLIKACGSTIGAVVALVFSPPRTRRGFVRRLTVSIPVGILFSWVPPRFIEFPDTVEGMVAAAALMAFVAWWAMGTVRRLVEKFEGR